MIDGQLRPNGVTGEAVNAAFEAVDRDLFVPAARKALAYMDGPIDLGAGRQVMEVLHLGRMLQVAAVKTGEKILVAGAGSGYGAALLAHMGAEVTALESDAGLAGMARQALAAAGFPGVAVVEGPLAQGHGAKAPYDLILVEGAVAAIPETLVAQLKDGGRLVTVIAGAGPTGQISVITKAGAVAGAKAFYDASVPVLAEFQREARFTL